MTPPQTLAALAEALARNDIDSALALFTPDAFWRDLVAFTWNIHTAEGHQAIRAMLEATLAETRPTDWTAEPNTGNAEQTWFHFETSTARGTGHLRLHDGKIKTILTAMQELKGHEENQGFSRENGVQHGATKSRRTWLDDRIQEAAELGISTQPFCLVVGGGQGGIGLGARLRRLGVPSLIIDRHLKPGDAWRRRYKSLCLHDPVWYDHMPYLPFPAHWPIFAPKDKLGDWLEAYVSLLELNYWPSTECSTARFDETNNEWIVELLRDGKPITLRPKHLVLATGMSGVPLIPTIPGAETFTGTQHHSSQHRDGKPYAGKRCVIIGSNNSAHDIAADLWENDAQVTMVQRSSTMVVRQETLRRLGSLGPYSEAAAQAGLTTDRADLTVAATPHRLQPAAQIPITAQIQADDAPFYESLRAAGFLLDFGDDNSGLGQKYLRRGSGYYIDVGASALIADGSIRLEQGEVARIEPDAVILANGKAIPADLIVYATGYGSMNGWAARLISQDVADRVGKCWGLGSNTTKDPGPWEGELRNMWKPTQQPNLWFHGGNLAQSRHYSRYLALQLKARLENIPTPVYQLAESHHRE